MKDAERIAELEAAKAEVERLRQRIAALEAENERLRATPAPGPDVSALVEALEKCAASLAWNCFVECRAIHAGPIMPATKALELAKAALAACCKRGEEK